MRESRFVFGLEAVPDVWALRRVHRVDAQLGDADVVDYAFQRQRALAGIDDLPAHLLKVVALSWVDLSAGSAVVQSFVSPEFDEDALLGLLFERLAAGPGVVWNAGGRELAILKRRALLYPDLPTSGLFASPARILDLSAELALAAGEALNVRDEMVRMIGAGSLPELGPAQTWQVWNAGRGENILGQCEAGALKTALLWLRASSSGCKELEELLESRLAAL
jgi:predicted PolB exonuclease-like 3'-5' exonuclease